MDVQVEQVIGAPVEQVASYMMDYRHDPDWTAVKTVTLSREAPDGGFGTGAQVSRTATFLGMKSIYVMNVEKFDPPRLMELRSERAPFPMLVTYQLQPHADGTCATIRIRTEGGFMGRVAPWMARSMIRATIRGDLKGLSKCLS